MIAPVLVDSAPANTERLRLVANPSQQGLVDTPG